MENCIFCKIINNEIPSYTLYEDSMFKVILDRFPSSIGHALVITKNHYNNLFELPYDESKEIISLVKKCAEAIKSATGCGGINILQNNGSAAGQTVSHYHMHIIPRYESDDIKISWNTVDPADVKFKETLDKIKPLLDKQ